MFGKALLTALLLTLVVAIAANRSQGAGRAQAYVVRPYDTLWAIAASHYAGDPREAIDRIERANGLASPLIRPGQHLVLP
jgi:LysM repeat protein